MAGREEQERRKSHTLLAASLARSGTQREILALLQQLIEKVGAEEAALTTIGYLQAQLGMTKPLSEVRANAKGQRQR